MSKTTNFDLDKLATTDDYAISQFNDNMDIIDEEMAKPPLTVNETEPDPVTRNINLEVVPLADNLTSDQAQINIGTFVERTSGGEASIADGSAWLSDLKGNQTKTGYIAESIQMSVTQADPTSENPISATLDRDEFVEAVTSSGTIILTYTTEWSADPADYGITVTGTPVNGDTITVVYVKENRGTITTASPTSFLSTGWNLYNHSAGYAQVVKYSDEYGFAISGTYTGLKFAATLSGEQTTITPTDGYFTVPSDGYVFVTGGNNTDTEIWMTWSDWTEEANEGVFAAYSSTTIDLSGVMVNFPAGLCKIGNVYDEINLNIGKAYSRIHRLEYTAENLESVIASGVAYDTDTNYIYAVRVEPVTYTITLDGEYTVSDHGIEVFNGTSVAITASLLYGNSLKNKLERDVLTISQGLVNNLESDATDKALTAKQGKALADQVATLNTHIVTIHTATNGNIHLFRNGNIVVCNIADGSYSTDAYGQITINSSTTLIPSGYRPYNEKYQIVDSYVNTRVQFETNGAIVLPAKMSASGVNIRCSATWITNDAMPT